MYIRKTVDIWEIIGFYAGQWEIVTTETTKADAKMNLKLYQENEPGTIFTMRKKRERINHD
jgi:hypothetical protein